MYLDLLVSDQLQEVRKWEKRFNCPSVIVIVSFGVEILQNLRQSVIYFL